MLDQSDLQAIAQLIDAKLQAQTVELKITLKEEINDALQKNNLKIAEIVTEAGEIVSRTLSKRIDALEHSIKDVETVTARNTFELQLIKGKA